MEGVWLVPLIKFYIKNLFGLEIELLYVLSSTNQYLVTLYVMVEDFMKNIEHQIIERNIWMMMGVVFFQNKMLEIFTMKKSK